MSSPAISICVPAYKAERFLRETLESVRAQTFSDWEIIVAEDGSKDGTEKIVEEFARTVPQRVLYRRHDPNRGLPATRNQAFSYSSGRWIALIDSDDLWLPNHLEALYEKTTEADIVHSGSQLFDSETGRDLEVRVPSAEDIAQFPLSVFLGSYVIQPSAVMIRRETWTQVGGFDPTFRYVEDREMWLRCVRAGARIVFNGQVTCRYRKHANAHSQNFVAMAAAVAQVCEKNVDWELLPRRIRFLETSEAWKSAGRLAAKDEPNLAADYFARALKYAPWAPPLWIHWSVARTRSICRVQK